MYSLTFCVRVMLPERHQWKPAVQAAAVMLRTPPSTASHRPASHTHFSYTARNFENVPRHPPLYHASKLHPGSCSSVGVRPQTDTDTHTHRRAWPQYILRRLRLTQNV